MPIARSSLAGAATGVVLLAGVVGFGVGLPEVIESPAAAAELPVLPDRLDDRFIAVSAATPEDFEASTPERTAEAEQIAAAFGDAEKTASENLDDVYGDVEVRYYRDIKASLAALAADPSGQTGAAEIVVTVVPGPAGPVLPQGPFESSQNGSYYELTKIDDHACAVRWVEAMDPTTGLPTGEAPTGANYQVECHVQGDGVTFDVVSSGLTPTEHEHYMDLILDITDQG